MLCGSIIDIEGYYNVHAMRQGNKDIKGYDNVDVMRQNYKDIKKFRIM